MFTQERSHDQLATSFALGETQTQATFKTSHAEIHPAPPSQNIMWHLAGIWYSKAVTSGYLHSSTWACSRRMLKVPSAHRSHLPSSVKSVSHSPQPVTNTLQTTGTQIHPVIPPERSQQSQECRSPGDYFQPGWESHWHSSQDPCAHAGTFLPTVAILHRLRFNRSIRVEEIIYWCKQDFITTKHRIWPFKRFLQNNCGMHSQGKFWVWNKIFPSSLTCLKTFCLEKDLPPPHTNWHLILMQTASS